jgi:hypothetical protein
MLDNLRNQASFQEDENSPEPTKQQPEIIKNRRSLDQFTGMNAKQRFMLALMLLVMVCLMGTMLLVAMNKIVLPFL